MQRAGEDIYPRSRVVVSMETSYPCGCSWVALTSQGEREGRGERGAGSGEELGARRLFKFELQTQMVVT